MSQLYALQTLDGDVFTLGGRILVHDNRAELEFLFPGRHTREVTGTTLPTMRWRDHPGMECISWPLNRKDFR